MLAFQCDVRHSPSIPCSILPGDSVPSLYAPICSFSGYYSSGDHPSQCCSSHQRHSSTFNARRRSFMVQESDWGPEEAGLVVYGQKVSQFVMLCLALSLLTCSVRVHALHSLYTSRTLSYSFARLSAALQAAAAVQFTPTHSPHTTLSSLHRRPHSLSAAVHAAALTPSSHTALAVFPHASLAAIMQTSAQQSSSQTTHHEVHSRDQPSMPCPQGPPIVARDRRRTPPAAILAAYPVRA